MKHISELQKTLSHFLDWNKARMICVVQILQALFSVRTINLTQIAAAYYSRGCIADLQEALGNRDLIRVS